MKPSPEGRFPAHLPETWASPDCWKLQAAQGLEQVPWNCGSKCPVGEAVPAPQPTIQSSRQRVGNTSYGSSDLILEREPARAGWGGAMWPQPVLECGVGDSLKARGQTALRVSMGVSLESNPRLSVYWTGF